MLLKDNGKVYIAGSGPTAVEMPKLENRFYRVEYDAHHNRIFLVEREPFILPEKIYGNVPERITKILTTYNDRGRNTGVLLSGQKGTGKTLLAKQACVQAGLPVLVVDSAGINLRTLSKFIESEIPDQQMIMFFDEFEKMFPATAEEKGVGQNILLTMLDGVFNTNILFMMTANYLNLVNEAMFNRPGRLFYHWQYNNMDIDIYNEVIDDLLTHTEVRKEFDVVYSVLGVLTMDMLVSIIEEVNRYGVRPQEAMGDMNIEIKDITFDIIAILPVTTRVYRHKVTKELIDAPDKTLSMMKMIDALMTSNKEDEIEWELIDEQEHLIEYEASSKENPIIDLLSDPESDTWIELPRARCYDQRVPSAQKTRELEFSIVRGDVTTYNEKHITRDGNKLIWKDENVLGQGASIIVEPRKAYAYERKDFAYL